MRRRWCGATGVGVPTQQVAQEHATRRRRAAAAALAHAVAAGVKRPPEMHLPLRAHAQPSRTAWPGSLGWIVAR
eukprot:5936827-Prymnesium_polylepis.1